MRVIGGVARGRALRAPKSATLRPTSDRVREAIFDVLDHLGALEAARVLDLFAGTGALGIEALSRGAASVTFVDERRAHLDAVAANLASTALADLAPTRLVTSEVLRFVSSSREHFDLVFADPPYAFDRWEELLRLLPGELVVLESRRPVELDDAHELHRTYRYGGTLVTVAWRVARGAGGGSVGGDRSRE